MTYPIDIRSGRGHYIFIAISGLFIIGLALIFMTTIGQSQRETIMIERFANIREMQATGIMPETVSDSPSINLKNIALYILCITIAGLTAFVTFWSAKMAYRNPITVQFDQLGLTLINNGIRNVDDMRVNWGDVDSVKFFSMRINLNRIRFVKLILKENKEIRKASIQNSSSSSNVISHALKRNLKGAVDLPYTGRGMGFSHEDYFEFIESEFLKYKTNPSHHSYSRRNMGRGGRLFG